MCLLLEIEYELQKQTNKQTNKQRKEPISVWNYFIMFPLTQFFRASASKYRLLRDYGQELITIATANTQSYRKGKVEGHM